MSLIMNWININFDFFRFYYGINNCSRNRIGGINFSFKIRFIKLLFTGFDGCLCKKFLFLNIFRLFCIYQNFFSEFGLLLTNLTNEFWLASEVPMNIVAYKLKLIFFLWLNALLIFATKLSTSGVCVNQNKKKKKITP